MPTSIMGDFNLYEGLIIKLCFFLVSYITILTVLKIRRDSCYER